MKYIILALLAIIAHFETVLIYSDPGTTIVTYPTLKGSSIQKIYSKNRPNDLGNQAQWIGIQGMNGWPNNYEATFQTFFPSDCPHQKANLIITADDVFVAYLNGKKVGTGNNLTRIYSLNINLACGINNLTIRVINFVENTPGALIFKVVQDQSNCYKCHHTTFYNFDTCRCQCEAKSTECTNSLKQWIREACGCKCTNQLFANCNPRLENFNQATCACQCKSIFCPIGLEQDPASCACKCKSTGCASGQRWNYNKCACEAIPCVKTSCSGLQVWNDASCGCVCPGNVACPLSQTFDSASCRCS